MRDDGCRIRDTFRLGRIAGVSVGISWTLLAVTALLTFGLAGGRYPSEAPGHTGTSYAVAGALTALLFLASVLLHELSHALVAKREGLEVDGISLWLLGGVTRIEGEATSPAAEVRISGAGPLASLALAVAFLAVAGLADLVNAPGLLVAVPAWLGTINLILALFNVLPGAPLDGGRLVHAFVWWRTGDRLRATVVASRAGRGVGMLLIAIGLASFAYNASADGLWLSVIGWFLINAARSEQGQAEVRHALHGVLVRDVMTPDPMVGPGWFTVQGFIDSYLLTHRHSAFPVEAWGTGVAGMVTLKQLRAVPPEQRGAVRVLDIAVPLHQVPAGRPDDELIDVLARIPAGGDGRVLVFEESELVGIVTPADVTRAMAHASFRTAAAH